MAAPFSQGFGIAALTLYYVARLTLQIVYRHRAMSVCHVTSKGPSICINKCIFS